MEIPGLTSSLNGGTGATKAAANFADNFDTFLNLLTTQLQNQDPLSPMDSAQFTEQLVQFSQVEQSIATNKNLEQALDLIGTGNEASAVSYLGREVKAQGSNASLSAGQANWSYKLADAAAKTTITVADQNGKLVYVGAGETATGEHPFAWDGKDNSGKSLPDGIYTMTVTAQDADGAQIAAKTYVEGSVTGINNDDTGTNLMLGQVAVPLSGVIEVREPAPAG